MCKIIRAVTGAVRPGFGTVWRPPFWGLVFETLVRSSVRLGRRWSRPWRAATSDLARCSLRLGRRWLVWPCKRGRPPNCQKPCKCKQNAPAVLYAPQHARDDMTHAWACGRPPNGQKTCKCKQNARAVLCGPGRSFQGGTENLVMCLRKQHSAIQHAIHNDARTVKRNSLAIMSRSPQIMCNCLMQVFSTPNESEKHCPGVAPVFRSECRACIVRAVVEPERVKRGHHRDSPTHAFNWSQLGLCEDFVCKHEQSKHQANPDALSCPPGATTRSCNKSLAHGTRTTIPQTAGILIGKDALLRPTRETKSCFGWRFPT